MAVPAPITGASSGATIIPFPDTLVAQARRELNQCRDRRTFNRWMERAMRYQQLSNDERVAIGRHAFRRYRIVRAEGC